MSCGTRSIGVQVSGSSSATSAAKSGRINRGIASRLRVMIVLRVAFGFSRTITKPITSGRRTRLVTYQRNRMAPYRANILIAIGIKGRGLILATDSDYVEQEMRDIGDDPDELGILSPSDYDSAGIYLWTGTLQYVADGLGSGGTEYDGELRLIACGELPDLLAMVPPTPPEPLENVF